MTDSELVLVIDAGTTNIKVFLFDQTLKPIFQAQASVEKIKPQSGWVEQDAEQIYETVVTLARQALVKADGRVRRLGITNQRETAVVWDGENGRLVYNAIVWEDERTHDYCESLTASGALVRERTGLKISAYFSASKIHWILNHVPNLPQTLKFGTIDSWLIFKLTGRHLTDYTNASRTLLLNVRELKWDQELLKLFEIPAEILPDVAGSRADYSVTKDEVFEQAIKVEAVIGDQQASMFAAGVEPGTVKVTYGTGIFPMKLIGQRFELKDGYSTTLALATGLEPQFALEGKVDNAAARVSPVLDQPDELNKVMAELARETDDILRPLLDGAREVLVDGGISQNNFVLAEQSKISKVDVHRLPYYNGSALGVAKLLFQ